MYLLRKGAYRDFFFTYYLKAHTIRNKLVSKASAQKKGGEVMTATNMCSNFGGFRYSSPPPVNADGLSCHWDIHGNTGLYRLIIYMEKFSEKIFTPKLLGLSHFPPKLKKNIFVVVITFSPFLLCK